MTTKIDFIGDIHGYYHNLVELLLKMGYYKHKNVYIHNDRIPLFLGDLVDRGPQIRETVELVRNMVEQGHAYIVMGNHEYNAVGFNWVKNDGTFVRDHADNKVVQHKETLNQFATYWSEWEDHLNWFKKIPLFIENEHFRAIHACWNKDEISYFKQHCPNHLINDDFWLKSSKKYTREYEAIDVLLKGLEIPLPDGLTFTDKQGYVRRRIRVNWWKKIEQPTLKNICVPPENHLPEIPMIDFYQNFEHYPENEKPIFFGHYWKNGIPKLETHNVCCLDFSIAKGGYLAAYRWNGEKILHENSFVYVK